VNRTSALWVLVLFFGASIVFAALRRLTDGESAAVTLAVQLGALALIVAAIVAVARRRR
jgi:DMSO reductase anchor subunit